MTESFHSELYLVHWRPDESTGTFGEEIASWRVAGFEEATKILSGALFNGKYDSAYVTTILRQWFTTGGNVQGHTPLFRDGVQGVVENWSLIYSLWYFHDVSEEIPHGP